LESEDPYNIPQSLLHLELDECELGDAGAYAIGQALMQSNKTKLRLKILSLKENAISDFGAARIAKGLEYCRSLKSLNLSKNHINDSGGELFAIALKYNDDLEELDLSYNDFRWSTGAAFFEGLRYNRRLRILNLESMIPA
jgi:Ran GTPase-activating protein (RanGAP) involved in mRNA processing and transport